MFLEIFEVQYDFKIELQLLKTCFEGHVENDIGRTFQLTSTINLYPWAAKE